MITFENVTKVYQRGVRPALDDVTVTIEQGEFAFLVGKSGSGKSTFLDLILRQIRPTSGTVHVLGKDVSRLSRWKVPQLRQEIGMVFQDFQLLESKTVFDNVALALQVIGKSKKQIRQAVPEVLELVGLSGKEKRLPGSLSGGEQQRVGIARAVINEPKILLADEPTGELDPEIAGDIMGLLFDINKSGTTVMMATHDREIVDAFRQRVIELVDGRIVRDQTRGSYGLK
ncbi:MAG: cell division ATP-binding protein FtsE [Actinomycetaceae bacterium]|nr:cell division ATP-binding protein FtsE [Actinomycetaceae bacterium]